MDCSLILFIYLFAYLFIEKGSCYTARLTWYLITPSGLHLTILQFPACEFKHKPPSLAVQGNRIQGFPVEAY